MPIRPKTHAQEMSARRRRAPDDRASASKRGYGSTWQKLRLIKLQDQPICQQPGCLKPATDVDHIKTLADGGENTLENLRSMCHSCHSRATALFDRGFGREKRIKELDNDNDANA